MPHSLLPHVLQFICNIPNHPNHSIYVKGQIVQDGKTVLYKRSQIYIYSGHPLKASPCMPAKQRFIYFYTVVHEYIYNIMAACYTILYMCSAIPCLFFNKAPTSSTFPLYISYILTLEFLSISTSSCMQGC